MDGIEARQQVDCELRSLERVVEVWRLGGAGGSVLI